MSKVEVRYSWEIWIKSIGCNARQNIPDSKVYGINMGPTWILSAPGGPYIDPMNIAIWDNIICVEYIACAVLWNIVSILNLKRWS